MINRFVSEERNLQGVAPAGGAGAINKSGGTMAMAMAMARS